MSQTLIKQTTGAAITPERLGALRAEVQGPVIVPGDAAYDAARTIWNAMIDRRPAVIVQCAGNADIVTALAFAHYNALTVAVRGGGHNIAGSAIADGGLVIDLSAMRTVRVDAMRMRAHVGPGALLADVDREMQAHGLVTPLGVNSTTGVAGLTLGGGFGWLSRKHGMTVDNLVSADVITAEGDLVRASATENAGLFWALRGGGGNFGIVTNFEFQLHHLKGLVHAGLVVFPMAQAASVLRAYRDLAPTLPDEANLWAIMRKAPPLPFLPADVHGTPVLVLPVFHAGDAAAAEELLARVKGFGTPVGVHFGAQPYTAWQQAFDPLLTPGARNYWKSQNFTELTDAAVADIVRLMDELPSPHCEVLIALLGGQVSRIAPEATAYPHRNAQFVMNLHGRWEHADEDERGVTWARNSNARMAPHSTGGVYVNFMTQEEHERLKGAYGPAWERLLELKRKWDPQNVFRTNQNIR